MSTIRILSVAAIGCFVFAGPAQAYLDPGTGSIIAQAVIGAVVAAGVFWRAWWHKVTTLFRKEKAADAETSPDSETKLTTGKP